MSVGLIGLQASSQAVPERVPECEFCHCHGDCKLGAGEECGWLDAKRDCCTNPSCLWARKNGIDLARKRTSATIRKAVGAVKRSMFNEIEARQDERRRQRERRRKLQAKRK